MSARADSITAHRRSSRDLARPPARDARMPGRRARAFNVAEQVLRLRSLPTSSERADVLRLRALRTLGDVELNLLVLIERAVSAAGDGRVVREHVGAAVLG